MLRSGWRSAAGRIRDVGDFLELNRNAIEERILQDAPLSNDGTHLVVSWDGVMVPIPGDKKTVWKEAGAGRLSIYDPPSESEPRPTLLDSRYLAHAGIGHDSIPHIHRVGPAKWSGHIESAAKNIVALRLKRSGMRWSIDGGQRVLNIRTLVKDDRWPVAWCLERRVA